MKMSRFIAPMVLGFVIVFFAAASPLFGEKPAENMAPVSGSAGKSIVRFDDLLGGSPTDPDKKRIGAVLKEAFGKDSVRKKMTLLKDKEIVFLSEMEAAIMALRKNLIIMVDKMESEMAHEALMEAEAVFDPVLTFSFFHSKSDADNRSKNVRIQTKRFLPGLPLRIPTAPNKSEAQIVELGWRNQEDGIRVTRELFASREPENGPTRTYQGAMNISQLLPWGPEIDISLATVHQEVFYDNDGHSYHAPYTSSLTLQLNSPLPWTKGFGPYAERDVAVKLTEKRNEWSFWSVKSTINTILLRVHDLYQRLFDDRLATIYDIHQIEAEYAATQVQEMAALNKLITGSNILAALIEDDPSRLEGLLYFPYRYREVLKQESDQGDALATAMAHRPELQMAELDLEQAGISRKFSKNELRPDIHFSAGLALGQDGSVYGYKTIPESLKNVFDEDIRKQRYSLTYTYPVRNRTLKARHVEAGEIENIRNYSMEAMENRVVREVNDALSMVQTSQARSSAARETLDFARIAYDRIQDRQKLGETNQFEWILNMQRLIEARLSLILAQIDQRIALAGLRAAEGTFENQYVNQLTRNPCDRMRIGKLEAKRVLMFFNTHPQSFRHSGDAIAGPESAERIQEPKP
ncbi:MAG: TolC family protein [Deltaproteobacteria bacterium]|nr:TolC family protein [Deltaproteobacteria bacterium]